MNFNDFKSYLCKFKKIICFLCRSTPGFYSNPEETSLSYGSEINHKSGERKSISFRPEESVSISIVRVVPYLVVLLCTELFIDYLFRVYLIF